MKHAATTHKQAKILVCYVPADEESNLRLRHLIDQLKGVGHSDKDDDSQQEAGGTTGSATGVELPQPLEPIVTLNTDCPGGEQDPSSWLKDRALESDYIILVWSDAYNRAFSEATSVLTQVGGTAIPILTQGMVKRAKPCRTGNVSVVYWHAHYSLPKVRKYNLADNRSCDALLKRVERTLRPERAQLSAGISFAIAGALLEFLGRLEPVEHFVWDNFGAMRHSVRQLMQIGTGFIIGVAIWLVLNAILRYLSSRPSVRKLPLLTEALGRWKHLPEAASTVIAAALAALVMFTAPPDAARLQKLVAKEVDSLKSRMLQETQPGAGIVVVAGGRERQAWTAAQVIVGALSAGTNLPGQVQVITNTFDFIESARLVRQTLTQPVLTAIGSRFGVEVNQSLLSLVGAEFNTPAQLRSLLRRVLGQQLAPEIEKEVMNITAQEKNRYEWGYSEHFPWAVTEIGAWICAAYSKSLAARSPPIWFGAQQDRAMHWVTNLVSDLIKRQGDEGGWSPIDTDLVQAATRGPLPAYHRTYSTLLVVWALSEAARIDNIDERLRTDIHMAIGRALHWLGDQFSEEFGWVPNPSTQVRREEFLGLSAQAIYIALCIPDSIDRKAYPKLVHAQNWLAARLESKEAFRRSPTKNDRMHDSDQYLPGTWHTIEKSTFLWYPWCVAACAKLAGDPKSEPSTRARFRAILLRLLERGGEFGSLAARELNYVSAEGCIGFGEASKVIH